VDEPVEAVWRHNAMINLVKIAFYATRAMRAAAEERTEDARKWLRKIESVRPLTSYEKAFEALLSHMDGNFTASDTMFSKVVEITESSSNPDDKYSYFYSKARLAALHDQEHLVPQYEDKARNTNCSSMVKGWLPLT
jgi:hypothetical protein